MTTLKASIFVLATLVSSPAAAQSAGNIDSLLQEYKQSYQSFFRSSKPNLVPLFLNEGGYQLGDVWDTTMTRLLASSSTCFGEMKPRVTRDTLPSLKYTTRQSIGLWLRLWKALTFDADEKTSFVVEVSFSDLTDELIDESALRSSFTRTQCEIAAPLMEGDKVKSGPDLPVVIGRLYKGKRNFSVVYAGAVDVKAKAADLAALTNGLPVSITASAAYGTDRAVIISDDKPVSLAFAPAFVPMRTAGATMGGPTNQPQEYRWLPFNPEKTPSQTVVLPGLTEQIAGEWKWRDR